MARHSELVKIPRIDRYITKLALGTAPLGGLFTSVAESDAESTILTAVDAGIKYFDTAPLYGYGNAERRLGSALNKSGKEFVISTKVGRVLNKITPENKSEDDSLGSYVDVDPTLTPILMTCASSPPFLPQATSVKATAATATAVRGVLREDKFIQSSEIKVDLLQSSKP